LAAFNDADYASALNETVKELIQVPVGLIVPVWVISTSEAHIMVIHTSTKTRAI